MKINPTRFKALIKSHHLTIESFAKELDLTRGGLYDVMKRDYVKPDLIKQICAILNVHADDFIDYESSENVQKNLTRETKGNIIYVPLYAFGGFLTGYKNTIFIESLDRFMLPGVTGEHYAFEIAGHSMYKLGDERSAIPGDIAISRLVEDFKHLWKGKGYILQTIDGILYKIFDQIKGEKAHFHSLNEEYDGYELPLKEIKRVYFVDFILKKQTNS